MDGVVLFFVVRLCCVRVLGDIRVFMLFCVSIKVFLSVKGNGFLWL